MNTDPYVVSFGSLHYDIAVNCPRQPFTGETLLGSAWQPKCGGKGGNQAVASARCGIKTYMIGAVAQDEFGKTLRHHLQNYKVDCTYLRYGAQQSTGMSVALFDDEGDYSAVIVSGANLTLGEEDVRTAQDILQGAAVTLLQNEVPEKANIKAASMTKKGSGRVILNAAPARPISTDLSTLVDVMIINKIEAEMLGKRSVDETLDGAHEAALFLVNHFKQSHKNTVPAIIVTAGGAGVAYADGKGQQIQLPAQKVKVHSTHGAGDTFTGVFAAHIAQGTPIEIALQEANAAAAAFVSNPNTSIKVRL